MRKTLVLLSFFCAAACSPGFSDSDINAVKQDIRKHYNERGGMTVDEVAFVRESRAKISGYVRMLIHGGGSINLPCSAKMDEASRRYIWRCGLGA